MYQQQETTIEQLFIDMGYHPDDMTINVPVDVSCLGFEVQTLTRENVVSWALIKSVIVKDETDAYIVRDFGLKVAPLHLFWAKVSGSEPHWVEATALVDCNDVELFHIVRGWVKTSVEHISEKIRILDIEVENVHSYFTNGVLSHNTLHGDPNITPGGKSIPFAASVRIRLSSGTQVKDKQGNVIGTHVIATLKKNKVAPPHRKFEFDILFGRGLVEDEYLFDEVRSWCEDKGPLIKDGKKVSITGSGTWKELSVIDDATGELVVSKKFTKTQFGEIRSSPEYGQYVADIIDAALTVKHGDVVQSDEGSDED